MKTMEILYDTLLYITINQNEKTMIDRIYEESEYLDEDMYYYYKLKRSVPAISDLDMLAPFCYCPTGHSSYLMSLLARYPSDSFDLTRFTSQLCGDRRLLSDFIDFTFPETSDADRSILLSEDILNVGRTYTKLFTVHNLPQELLNSFTIFTCAYTRCISAVVHVISCIYPLVKTLHEQESERKHKVVQSVTDRRELLNKAYELSPIIPVSVHVTLMNPFAVCQQAIINEKYQFIVGEKGLEHLKPKYEHISLEVFCESIKGHIAWSIVNELMIRDVCVKDITCKFGHSRTSVYEVIDKLITKGIILSSGYTRNTYYRLNQIYLKALISEIQHICEMISERKNKPTGAEKSPSFAQSSKKPEL